ncbi:MAG: hypothetical protein WHS38_04330 [Thermodesulforhabdaceae bacterium]
MQKKIVATLGVVFWAFMASIAHGGDIMATLHNGNTLTFPYCWKKGNEIKFDAPGGTVGLSMADIQTIEERIMHADIDSQYLLSKAIEGPTGDNLVILMDFLKKRRNITIAEGKPTKQGPSPSKHSPPGDTQLIAPVTKLFDSYAQAFKTSKGGTILIGAFVNSREELEGRKCYVKLLDMEKKTIHRQPLSIKRLNVPEEQQVKHKLSPLFYLIYGSFPAGSEFWAYDVVCELMI